MNRQANTPAPAAGTVPRGNGGATVRQRLIVVGSGIAGLYAALLAADAGADVVLLSKGQLRESNTWYAQGGISAVLDEPAPGDTVAAHITDTLLAGAGHCDEAAVRLMCTEARRDIAGLERFGVHFDTGAGGGPALGLEAAHSAPRILHAGGDATGTKVAAALIRTVLARQADGTLTIHTGAHATALLQEQGTVNGVEFVRDGRSASLRGDAVLLATGGAGQLFAQTTNPAVATADGLALAVRVGAAVADLEFFQFHPTCLVPGASAANPGTAPALDQDPLLISEAVRGEGAILVDGNGKRFMRAYHSDAELAPRDVVSRSIALHLAKLGDPNGHVYLDARVIEQTKGPGFLAERFPTLSQRTRDAGIDWTRELVPVAPAAHYWMGGVATDLHARTTVPGLYAAGEVACTGVQGANRLASNSLLEGLVFGRRAVEDFLSGEDGSGWGAPAEAVPPLAVSAAGGLPLTLASGTPSADVGQQTLGAGQETQTPGEAAGISGFGGGGGRETAFSREALRRLMTAKAGVLRSGALLREAGEALVHWAAVVRPEAVSAGTDTRLHEDRNLLLAAQMLVAAAHERSESLGAHYRSDDPADAAGIAAEFEESSRTRPKASLVHE
ncbi:L-aspartate oxidase [Pseudarthrobacter siccitolerans]|uniref:L-aspartate oxidase n=1 Tax=Pseudarthrobacter siccitolerans TaxID=861266 RepID=A0ABU0PHB3_9MICC|nr:FAD-dependent oxidoreductase [Pseudarthrobacter siccitolerans]MDQ0673331.1 L-aspartate oxidase [Pseudarthrobacter siccitolerans]